MRVGRPAILVTLLLLAAGCAAPAGDFGRPRPSVFNDTILPLAGGAVAYVRGEPVSFGPLTDDERQLRDLSYAILMPPHERQHWERTLAELHRTRVLPDDLPSFDPTYYSDTLLLTPFRSSTARYARLMEDVRADSTRIGPFFVVAGRVAEMDAVRQKALANMIHLSAAERESAAARIDENWMLIAWVQRRFRERFAGYRLALERLVVATPAPAAIEAERTLRVLQERIEEIPPVTQLAALVPPPQGGVVSK